MRKNIYIIGGGAINYVRVHFAISAPSYGSTARALAPMFQEELKSAGLEDKYDVKLVLTKMADYTSKIETVEDVSKWVDQMIADPQTKAIIFNVAMADAEGKIGDVTSGKKAKRLASRELNGQSMQLSMSEKIIEKIRKNRKDIFAVGFKTTDNDTRVVQYQKGLKLMKDNSLNLVLVNDVIKYENMIVVPEEATYRFDKREDALRMLARMTVSRMQNTFTRSTVVEGDSIDWNSSEIPENLRKVVNHCIQKGAYKPFQGKTVGHFAVKIADGIIYTSKRKTNFNELDVNGLVKIVSNGDNEVVAYGAKPSVGGQSQRIIFTEHPSMDCIAHFHCPIKDDAPQMMEIPVVQQWPNECGSHECGRKTSQGLKEFDLGDGDLIKVVYLDEHGPNIVFNRDINPFKVINFIDENFDLSAKTGGLFETV